MSNDILIDAYKNMRGLIKSTPTNKENIINEFIDLVNKVSSKQDIKTTATISKSGDLGDMLKNPLEINIYNNFQKYNSPISDLSKQPSQYKQFRTPEQSKQYIIDAKIK
jgi:hypothetical protein